ncbi:uncharacterized protein LOC131655386 [Vicia villosa]|uniref:uncharacterized protein LOC131655386 n=1 Tax=Vicia villosa TaxID=3911 RepID=UPI00273BBA58|nr:uncharacterized protein LOC131655386 [Vicia villosa]
MANLRKPKDKDSMFNVNGGRCKKHPKHVQSPGVCSLCLKDKLDQLSSSSSSSTSQNTNSASCSSSCSSLSSYYSSSSGSSCSSPMHDDGSSFSTIFLFHKHGGLVKSKSMAAVIPRRRNKDGRDHQYSKKSGFWFNLFHPSYKNKRMVTVAS